MQMQVPDEPMAFAFELAFELKKVLIQQVPDSNINAVQCILLF